MHNARVMGNYIQSLAEQKHLKSSDLGTLLDCDERQIMMLYKGRAFVPFDKMKLLASKFGVTVSELLQGNEEHYNNTVVHCMNSFDNVNNREMILDIIDDYMDVFDAVNN